ncbi:MAG: DUF4129 domain-containing protein [Promethearchaeota archaeon]
MNAKDFSFVLRKKEFLTLCLLLLTVTLAQFSLGQISGIVKSGPFLTINNSLLDVLGLILPLISGAYIYINYRGKHNPVVSLIVLSIGVIVIVTVIFAAFLGVPFLNEEEAEGEPESPNIIPTSPITNIPVTDITDELTQPVLPPVDFLSYNDFIQSLGYLGIFFLIFLLFLPFLFMFVVRRKGEDDEIDLETGEIDLQHEKEKYYQVRTVLECYYQASTALEERGADDSPNFTPTEFSQDVVTKDLTDPPLIEDLTEVFEEVKFSNHAISDQQVDLAKSVSKKIIFPPDLVENEEEETED